MNTNPTPYQLSKLAIMAGSWFYDPSKHFRPIEKTDEVPRMAFDKKIDQAVEIALAIWRKSTNVIEAHHDADEQLKILRDEIFTMKSDEWRERMKDYKGLVHQMVKALMQPTFKTEDVKLRLFPDKNMSRGTRDKLFMALPKFAVAHRVARITGQVPTTTDLPDMEAELLRPSMSLNTARFLYEARQIQIAFARRHGKA